MPCRRKGWVDVPLSFKYAFRHVVKRNPLVLRWCAELMSREHAHPRVHRARQEILLDDVYRAARRIPAYSKLAVAAPETNRLEYLTAAFPIIDKAALLGDAA